MVQIGNNRGHSVHGRKNDDQRSRSDRNSDDADPGNDINGIVRFFRDQVAFGYEE